MILEMKSLLDEFNSKVETSKYQDSKLQERAKELSYPRKKDKKDGNKEQTPQWPVGDCQTVYEESKKEKE